MQNKLIKKYQNASGPLILKNDNTKSNKPILRIPINDEIDWVQAEKETNQRAANKARSEQQHSEVIRVPEVYDGNDQGEAFIRSFTGNRPTSTITQVIGLSPVDPVGELVVGNAFLNAPLKLVGKGLAHVIRTNRNTYTDDLIKLLGNKKDPLPFKGDRNGVTKEFAEYLQKLGVDVNRFTNKDLILLQNMRRQSILDNIPANQRVITLAELNYQPNKYVEYYLRENNEILGELNTANLGKVQHIQNIKSYNPKKHNVSRDLYDAALNYQNRGVISGEILHSPEQTIHIWNKYYPKRKLISTDGVHTYNFGENIAKSGERYTVTNGPVVDLKQSWGRLPMKSQTIFHPKIIDKNTWTLKAPNWNDKNIYTALIPIGYFLSTNQSNR